MERVLGLGRMVLTAVAEVADSVVNEHARLQDAGRGGRDGGAGADTDGRRGPRRVLVDDDVGGGDHRRRGAGRVAAEAGEQRSETEEAAGDGSG